jgi:ribonuclease D
LLLKHHEFVPSAIFDTMLAARLLGLRQFSLSSLVEQYLGVKLEKGAQKANWAMRPLTERMERYALNDTHYLKSLADKLNSELAAKNRLNWHQESCARLVVACAIDPIPDLDSVWRVKGSHLLGRPALAILRELWRWRESEALGANKPPYFVMKHETLVEIAAAAAMARPIDAFLPKHFSDRRRGGLMKAIAKGLGLAPDDHPKILRSIGRRPSEAERRRYLELQKYRDAHATALSIDPTLIASRAMLSDLARDWDKFYPELMSWQKELLKP